MRDEPATGGVRFKTGLASAADPATGSVRVRFDDIGIETYWLPVCYPKTGQDKFYWLPDIGEQVRCIMDERLEDGSVLGGTYSAEDAVPWVSNDRCGMRFRDGGEFSYDRASGDMVAIVKGKLTATVSGLAAIKAQAVHIEADEVVIDAQLRVKKPTLLEGGVGGAAGASTPIPGSVKAENDVVAGRISLRDHHHIDSQGGNTSDAK
ncbi:MAG: phage baseplate assembly protein V [Burkholderia gladioli]